MEIKIKNNKFYINDYDFRGSGNLGVFFYDEQVLFGWEKDRGVQSYKFVLELSWGSRSLARLIRFDEAEGYVEKISFIYTCDLKNYAYSHKLPKDKETDRVWGDTKELIFLDYHKLMLEACPKRLEGAADRIMRFEQTIVPAPIYYSATEWHKSDEFLEFTKESACSWGGPFVQDGKEGACLSIKKQKKRKYPIFNVATNYSYYDLPYHIQKITDGMATGKVKRGDYWMGEVSTKEKVKFFNSLSARDKHSTALEYYNKYWYKEYIESILPYKIYLCGNDDCSYSKWFATQEEVDKEVEYLRKMQPLCFGRDICQRGYIFTN